MKAKGRLKNRKFVSQPKEFDVASHTFYNKQTWSILVGGFCILVAVIIGAKMLLGQW